uniref:Uncharacterized protein n=1 Tax=Rhizophora mucronata TaxID=61149 RepID=A0A2P2NX89_RHIMU
MVCFGFTAKIY